MELYSGSERHVSDGVVGPISVEIIIGITKVALELLTDTAPLYSG